MVIPGIDVRARADKHVEEQLSPLVVTELDEYDLEQVQRRLSVGVSGLYIGPETPTDRRR